ncbi:FecR family protein [Telluribacter humicola]|uniref:FecR family protein n=1 Tax=Telluribacter humicola TaxID=1720261 RepID=UPI001A974A8F|nr:FecR family protein [Telluribacter humicola]
MKDELYIKRLLDKYLAKECTEAEIKELLACLESPEGKQVLAEIMDEEAAQLEVLNLEVRPDVSDRMHSRLMQSIEQAEVPAPVYRLPIYQRRSFWQLAAAFVGLLLLVGVGMYALDQTGKQTYTTEVSQKRTVLLPDGSRVILNSSSMITYTTQWLGEEARRVELEGEAFFDVKHDRERPFYVKTARAEIKVLGTAFNVRSSSSSNTFETTLIRGKVVVKDLCAPERPETVLKPNEKAVLSNELARIKTTKAEPEPASYWQKGQLVFEDEPIQVIAEELEKWYNVQIEIEEASKDCRFHLNVEKETLPDVLRLFESLTGVRPIISGNQVTLKGKLCDTNRPN